MPASINDWGGSSPDTLNNPPLGGPDGWAAAVAKVANEDDTTVNDRLTTAITAHEAAADPHPVYLKPSEVVAGANITVTENAGVVTIAGQAGGGGGGASILDDLTDVSAPADTPAGKVLGTTAEGVWGPVDPPAGGGGGGGIEVVEATRTAGNVTIPTTGPIAIDTAIDLVVTAKAGDHLAVSLDGLLNAPGTAGSWLAFDAATIVSSAVVNYIGVRTSTYGNGALAWFVSGPSTDGAGGLCNLGGTCLYLVQPEDVSGGQVRLRLYAKASTVSRVLRAGVGSDRFRWWVENLSTGGGGASILDDLTDVVAPANTPAGKVLGTTAEGVWGPVDAPSGGGGGEIVLASTYLSGAFTSVGSTSTTHADVHADFAVTFTAPASGIVKVRIDASINIATANAAYDWGLREGSTVLPGSVVRVGQVNYGQSRVHYYVRITGLTPGSVHTFKLSHARASGSGNPSTYWGTGTAGLDDPASMEVIAG
jgi:hypothetical protein